MNEPIKAGDLCEVVDGWMGPLSPNLGRHVTVVSFQGESHSGEFGRIWRCTGDIVTADGEVRDWANFPAEWLRRIDPPVKTDTATNEREVAA